MKEEEKSSSQDRSYVFGPVPSRRLGRSLGVDLVPLKTCSFDCLYCQAGKTTHKVVDLKPYTPIADVLKEIREKIDEVSPDIITFSGSGEPTLHSEIGNAIKFIREITDRKIAVLTNGSLLWRKDVRESVAGADIVMPTLSTVSENTFLRIHRPHPELKLKKIIKGIKQLREIGKGQLFLEVIFLAGINDGDGEIEALGKVVDQISPHRIQINTVVRPPSDPKALSLDMQRLKDIKNLFGANAEIIADIKPKQDETHFESMDLMILEMTKRRPLRAIDVANSLSIPIETAEKLIKGLTIKGALRERMHSGETYYLI